MSKKNRNSTSAFTIVWTDRAKDDLAAIGDYIAADNPRASIQWVGKLIADVERVAAMPMSGRIVPEFAERDDIREAIRRTYRIVYQIMDDTVHVLTIFEGHRLFPEDTITKDNND